MLTVSTSAKVIGPTVDRRGRLMEMTTLRVIGRFTGAVILVVALAGCGDDGDTTTTDDNGSAAETSEDVDQSADAADEDAADDGDDAAGSEDSSEGSEDSGESGGSESDAEDSGDDTDSGSGSEDGGSGAAPGVYKDYSEEAVADTSYDATILFFHASWCPECRAFEQAIQDEGVPDGVQILKTDYDTEQDLRERYGVNHQSWFVKVDSGGDKVSDWLGYGEDKSVDTILEQLG